MLHLFAFQQSLLFYWGYLRKILYPPAFLLSQRKDSAVDLRRKTYHIFAKKQNLRTSVLQHQFLFHCRVAIESQGGLNQEILFPCFCFCTKEEARTLPE